MKVDDILALLNEMENPETSIHDTIKKYTLTNIDTLWEITNGFTDFIARQFEVDYETASHILTVCQIIAQGTAAGNQGVIEDIHGVQLDDQMKKALIAKHFAAYVCSMLFE